MKGDDYMRSRLGEGLTTEAGTVPVYAVRVPQERITKPTVPAVIWRLSGIGSPGSLGPGWRPQFVLYDIECRAPTHQQAAALMGRVLVILAPLTEEVLALEDEPDDVAQKISFPRSYHSRVARIRLRNLNPPSE